MFTFLRRVFWLSLIGGAGYAGFTVWQRRSAGDEAAGSPQWPPLPDTKAPPEPVARPAVAVTEDQPQSRSESDSASESVRGGAGWTEPIDGGCPDGYPIKANDNSGIYHVPGGRFYERTIPERCYSTAEGAAADGYRAAKA